MENEAHVRFVEVEKTYDREIVVRDLSLDLACGEVLTSLGSSGSGKTACLMNPRGLRGGDAG